MVYLMGYYNLPIVSLGPLPRRYCDCVAFVLLLTLLKEREPELIVYIRRYFCFFLS